MHQKSLTIGEAMLEVFRAYGAEYIFSSPGSEWSPLWDALAKAKAEGKGPTFINTRHESFTVSLAAGYYRQTRRLPIVALHTTVGTLQAAMALNTAQHDRTPMVVLAGDSAGFGEMPGPDPGFQWARMLATASSSAGVAQPYVKRATSVTSCEVLPGMLQDACRLALTPPCGPVFLAIPFEHMVGNCPRAEFRCAPPPPPAHASSELLQDVARQLVEARQPVLITEYAGRDVSNVPALIELAERLGLPVIEGRQPVYLNFPRNHPLHQGFDASELLANADLVLLVASYMPWYPSSKAPRAAKVILIDDDPARELIPYWGYSVDQVIAGDLNSSLRRLVDSVRGLTEGSTMMEEVRAERWCRWQARHESLWQQWRSEALSVSQCAPMDPRWVIHTLGEILPPDTIVSEETVSYKGLIGRYLRRSLPGTVQSRNRGGLGVGLGIAMGLKFGAPERLVAAVLGDGAFNYSPVLAAFGFAQQFCAPILILLLNNQGYAAMKKALVEYYPDGWSVRTGTYCGSEIEPTPDYPAIARAFGGWGERVDDPGALADALRRAIERVQNGQLALLDIIVGDVTNRC